MRKTKKYMKGTIKCEAGPGFRKEEQKSKDEAQTERLHAQRTQEEMRKHQNKERKDSKVRDLRFKIIIEDSKNKN